MKSYYLNLALEILLIISHYEAIQNVFDLINLII